MDPVLGAVVAEVLQRVIKAAEKAIEWPKYCYKLKELLQSLGPIVAEITSQEAQDGIHSSAIRCWLDGLRARLLEAEAVLEKCAHPTHQWNALNRSKCGYKLAETTSNIKDFLQSQALIPTLGILMQHMKTMDVAVQDLRQQVAQLNVGLETKKWMVSEVLNKERAFYAMKNSVERLSIATLPSLHLGASSSSSDMSKTIGMESEALEMQPIPQFVYGMEEVNEQIQNVLLASREGSYGLSKWVGLWAPGGAGKTLAVQIPMNNPMVESHFNGRVYVLGVGRSPDLVGLQQKLYKKIGGSNFWEDWRSPSEGKSKLYNLLRGIKCLLILDDVWEPRHLECFDVVSQAGSCILITTRNQPVLQRVHATELRLHMLSREHSMELFCVHAFGGEERMPDHLVKVVANIVAECKGLPLSLKVVGGALAGRMELHYWEMALQKLRDAESLNPEYEVQVFHRLKMSYDDLETFDQGGKLYKECFLYFAAFPEDMEIQADHLFQLWAGEGLIGQDASKIDPETEAYCVLGILIGRSLIELEKGWSMEQSTPAFSCKIHDVLRDMGLYILHNGRETWEQRCLFKAGWQKPAAGGGTIRCDAQLPQSWLHAASSNGSTVHKNSCNIMQAQKVSLAGSSISSLPSKVGVTSLEPPPMKVLLLNGCPDLTTIDGPFLSHFINLRVLDLSKSNIRLLPKSLGKLRQLTLLNLRSTGLESLPAAIGKLCIEPAKL